ncbi:MAG: hypothetical protein ACI89J_001813 [Hyphomicrobiaceae bacterium]|jgi:hypothetical protein
MLNLNELIALFIELNEAILVQRPTIVKWHVLELEQQIARTRESRIDILGVVVDA